MKRILYYGLALVIIILLTACTKREVYQHSFTFQGESELWKAEYSYYGEDIFTTRTDGTTDTDTQSEGELVVTYQGELSDLADVRHYEIGYEANTCSSKLTCDLQEGEQIKSKVFTMKESGRITESDQVIKVTIVMDDVVQTLELKQK